MKANKALRRLSKIEALLSDVTERYSASGPHIRELLRDAKAAVIRAKKAVQASSGTATNPPVKHSQPLSKTAPEPSKPKPTLSAAGRKAISDATKKRWAAKRAAAVKPGSAVAKKAAVRKSTPVKVVVKKSAPVKTAKPPIRKVARKAPAKKAAVKAQSKKAVRVVQAANPTPAPPKIEDAAVTTP